MSKTRLFKEKVMPLTIALTPSAQQALKDVFGDQGVSRGIRELIDEYLNKLNNPTNKLIKLREQLEATRKLSNENATSNSELEASIRQLTVDIKACEEAVGIETARKEEQKAEMAELASMQVEFKKIPPKAAQQLWNSVRQRLHKQNKSTPRNDLERMKLVLAEYNTTTSMPAVEHLTAAGVIKDDEIPTAAPAKPPKTDRRFKYELCYYCQDCNKDVTQSHEGNMPGHHVVKKNSE